MRLEGGKAIASKIEVVGSPDQAPSVEGLVEGAKVAGFLSWSDILEVLPEPENSLEQLDHLFALLQREGIRFDRDDGAASPTGEGAESEIATSVALVDLAALESNDPMDLYMREMGQVPLLTIEEEVTLAIRMEQGRDAAQLLGVGVDDAVEDERLNALVRSGRDARWHLIEANTRLVVNVAKRYRNMGLPFLDLIQAGNIGLIKAVDKFEYRRGFRFATYATWWIRQAVTRSLSQLSRTIRIPVHTDDRVRRVYRVSQSLEQRLGRRPEPEEIAEEIEGTDPEDVRWLLRVSRQPKSLNTRVSDEGDSDEFGDLLPDEAVVRPEASVEQQMLAEDVRAVVATLSPREARILRLRYGLDGGGDHTLKEIGEKFGVTRERVRQIEMRALRKLRHPSHSRVLREYLS